MAKGKLVQLRVDAEDVERWRAEAARRGMSLSALVRWAMDRPLREGCWEPIEMPAEAAEALDRGTEVKAAVVGAMAGQMVDGADEGEEDYPRCRCGGGRIVRDDLCEDCLAERTREEAEVDEPEPE